MAKQLIKALEPHDPMFVEEPLLPEYSYLLDDLANGTTVPFATGERLYSRFAFTPLLSEGGIDVAQPNICAVGGITETQKIASIAETWDAGIAPTHPDGSISFAASLHVCLNASNALILDYGSENTTFDYISDKSTIQFDGDYVTIDDSPGLGIDVDIDQIRDQAMDSMDWENPTWRHEDGSIAEW
jgi:galactonate dehydratase